MTSKHNEPDIVPEKLTAPINFKIIALIIATVVTIQVVIGFSEEEPIEFIYIVSMGIPLSVSILSFMNYKKYKDMLIYGKAYISLGIAFLGLFLGEVTYFIYEQFLNLDPYPSIADIFFYLLYVMAIIYLVIHIKFFSTNMQKKDKFLITIIPILIISAYLLISYNSESELNFDFYYSIAFVSAISVTLGLSVYGVRIFQQGLIGTHWILFSIGILLFTFGDSWYYHLELGEGYSLSHPVNMFWYGGYLVILYALLHHRKII